MLNESQQQVIDNKYKNLLVLAPAGTGKTRVISELVTNLLQAGYTGREILALTFTNKAAKEMEDRIKSQVPDNELTINTFHGFCYKIISKYSDYLGMYEAPIVADESFALEVTQDFLQTIKPDLVPFAGMIKKVIDTYSYFKIKMTTKEANSAVGKEIANRYRKGGPLINNSIVRKALFEDYLYIRLCSYYEKRLNIIGAVDFNQLLSFMKTLLIEHSDVRTALQERYKHFIIDEFQDTSEVEMEIISYINTDNAIIQCFGDKNQTIFSWRGSDLAGNIATLKKLKPNYLEISLDTCYRSTSNIIEFCNQFTTGHTKLNCVKGEGSVPIMYVDEVLNNLNSNLVQTLQSSTGSKAILVRDNKMLSSLAETLRGKGLNIVTAEFMQILKQPIIKKLIDFVKYAVNPYDITAYRHLLIMLLGNKSELPKTISTLTKKYRLPLTLPINDNLYSNFESALTNGKVAVVDIETTGTDLTDSIVQIAAVVVDKEKVIKEFEVYVSGIDVGESVNVHHISNEFLQENGVPLKEALDKFNAFLQEHNVQFTVGHNYQFDANTINRNYFKFYGKPLLDLRDTLDTLALAPYHFPKADNYKLETLSNIIGVKHKPTHNALDDVLATYELLQIVYPTPKQEVYASFLDPSLREATNLIEKFVDYLRTTPTIYEAFQYILKDLNKCMTFTDIEINNIQMFTTFLFKYQLLFSAQLNILESLSQFLTYTALHSSEVILDENGEDPIYLLTVHMAKGLEFDNVFIYGISKNCFPSYFAEKGIADYDEEIRLFYVAASRAKQNLYIFGGTTNKLQERIKSANFINIANVEGTIDKEWKRQLEEQNQRINSKWS